MKPLKLNKTVIGLGIICFALLLSGCIHSVDTTTNMPTATPPSLSDNTPVTSNTLVDTAITAAQGNYTYETIDLTSGETIDINVYSTNDEPFVFWVLDPTDFNTYSNGMSSGNAATWNSEIGNQGVDIYNGTYTFTAPTTDLYYLIVDNTGLIDGGPTASSEVDTYLTVTETGGASNEYSPTNTQTITPTIPATPTIYPPLMSQLDAIMEKHPDYVYPDPNTLSDLSKTLEANPDYKLEYRGNGKWGFYNPNPTKSGSGGGSSGTSQGDWYDQVQQETGGALPPLSSD